MSVAREGAMIVKMLLIALIPALLLAACAPANDAEFNEGETALGDGSAGSAPLVSWFEAHEEYSPLFTLSGCEKPFRFTVRHDGIFAAGPCKPGRAKAHGQLTAEELERISRLADAVSRSDIALRAECEVHLHLGADEVFLTLPPNSRLKVKSYASASFQVCYHGGRDAVRPLTEALRRLMKRYYPE